MLPVKFGGSCREIDTIHEGAATFITHEEAEAFCKELSQRGWAEGRLSPNWEFRLPTEAQWEYACRAGTSTRFFWGDDRAILDNYAWFKQNTNEFDWRAYPPVGLKRPNAWGLGDMLGNVSEWCRDWYRAELPGGIDPEQATDEGSGYVNRGGSSDCPLYRSASRAHYWPRSDMPDGGLRVAAVQVQN